LIVNITNHIDLLKNYGLIGINANTALAEICTHIAALESKLQAAEEKLALSVPFEVVKKECESMCDFNGSKMICHKEDIYCTTPENCPIIPREGE
jgi:hypothetical protein